MALRAEQYPPYRPLVADALRQGSNMSMQDIDEGVSRGTIIPFIHQGALMTFELGEDSLHGITIAGKLERGWEREVLPVLERVAVEQNRRIISLRGRKGWTRKLKPLGFRLDGERLIKEVRI